MKYALVILATLLILSGCQAGDTQQTKDTQIVNQQQAQYAIGQPVPQYDFSLERDLLIKLYNLRNNRVATHSVWRSDYGMIEYDCPSMGYGLPYDTSLTNPQMATNESDTGWRASGLTSIGQPEPNGIFASQNTSATWVMCVGPGGSIEPHYVETKVTVFPYTVSVDYETNRITRTGTDSVNIGE